MVWYIRFQTWAYSILQLLTFHLLSFILPFFSFFRNITFPTWNSVLSIQFPFIFLAHSISSAIKLPPHLAYFSSSAYYSFSIHLKPFIFNPNPVSSAEFLDTEEQGFPFKEIIMMKAHYLYLSLWFLFGKLLTAWYLHFVLLVNAKHSPNFITEPTFDLRWLRMKSHHRFSENILSSNELLYYVTFTVYLQHYYGSKSKIIKKRAHILRIGRWEVKYVHEVHYSNLNQNDPVEISHKLWNGSWGNIVWIYGLNSSVSGQ